MGGVEIMTVGEGVEGRGKGVSLCVKFNTSRMLPSGIFWWGFSCSCCSCCDNKTNKQTGSTTSLKLKLGLWTGV